LFRNRRTRCVIFLEVSSDSKKVITKQDIINLLKRRSDITGDTLFRRTRTIISWFKWVRNNNSCLSSTVSMLLYVTICYYMLLQEIMIHFFSDVIILGDIYLLITIKRRSFCYKTSSSISVVFGARIILCSPRRKIE
jgi:hypothetical protein